MNFAFFSHWGGAVANCKTEFWLVWLDGLKSSRPSDVICLTFWKLEHNIASYFRYADCVNQLGGVRSGKQLWSDVNNLVAFCYFEFNFEHVMIICCERNYCPRGMYMCSISCYYHKAGFGVVILFGMYIEILEMFSHICGHERCGWVGLD